MVYVWSYLEEVTFDLGFEYPENEDEQRGQSSRHSKLESIVQPSIFPIFCHFSEKADIRTD